MATPVVLLSRLGFVGFSKEATQGTPLAATFYPQCSTIKGELVPEMIPDDSMVSSAGKIRAMYQGVLDGTFEVSGLVFPDTIGNFLVAAGFADTVTGSSSPWTHTFKIPAAGTQPPSYTITWHTGESASSVAYPGAVLDTLDFTYANKGALKYTAKFKTWAPVLIAKPTPAFGAINAQLDWQVTGSIAAAPQTTLLSSAINVKRSTESIHTGSGSQNPFLNFAKDVEAGMKAKFIVQDRVIWTHLSSNDQPSMSFSASSSTTAIFTATSTVTGWSKAPVNQNLNGYVDIGDIDITGITNATDVGPIAFTLVNTASSSY